MRNKIEIIGLIVILILIITIILSQGAFNSAIDYIRMSFNLSYNRTISSPIYKDIVGEWEYVGSSGGITGETRKVNLEKASISFGKDLSYKIFSNSKVATVGTYRIYKEKGDNIIYFDKGIHGLYGKETYEVLQYGKSSMSLWDRAYDGYTFNYSRKQ